MNGIFHCPSPIITLYFEIKLIIFQIKNNSFSLTCAWITLFHESSITSYEICTFLSLNIHFILLPEHIHPHEIFGVFHMSQDVSSPSYPEDHVKKKIKFCHLLTFNDIDWQSHFQKYSCYSNYQFKVLNTF